MIPEAQLQRIHRERVCKLVHRSLEGEGSGRFAGRALERRRAHVELHQPVCRRRVGAGIERARGLRGRLDKVLELGSVRKHFMTDRRQLSVAARSQQHALLGERPAADRSEHLRSDQRELYRPLELPRGDRGQNHVRPHRALATEASTDERRNDAHIIRRNAERLGDRLAHARDILRGVVEREPIAVPTRDGGVRLHWMVMLHRRRVHRLDADFRLRNSGLEIAPREGCWCTPRLLRSIGVASRLIEAKHRRLQLVEYAQKRRGIGRALESVGDDKRDRLSVVMDDVVLQQRQCAPRRRIDRGHAVLRQSRRVLVRKHEQDAGRARGDGAVDPADAAARHGALDEDRISKSRLIKLGRIPGRSRDFQRAVDAIDRATDHGAHVVAHATPPAVRSARATQRCASSTLNALSR